MKRGIIFIIISGIYSLQGFSYNRTAAVNYALTWCDTFNLQYGDYSGRGGDCANFVSQCLKAGGLNLYDPCKHAWDPELWGKGGTYPHIKDLVNFLECIAEEDYDPSCVRPGDVALYLDPQTGEPFHSLIVTDVNPVRVASHTYPRCGVPLDAGVIVKFYRILDYYEFYSEYIGGYYYTLMGNWQGPVQYEGVSAVGYKPSSHQEFAGFNSFKITGLPQNAPIKKAYLKLVENGTGGTSDVLHFNIKFTGNITPPSVYDIINPPFHLEDQVFPYITPDISYEYYLLPDVLYPEIINANNNSEPFVLGYSRYDNNNAMRYFYDYSWGSDLDATLLVFVDACGLKKNLMIKEKSGNEKVLLKIQTNLRKNTMMILYRLPADAHLEISIVNIDGRKIKTLFSGYQPAGEYNLFWDLKDEQRKEVLEGVYFLIFKMGEQIESKKIILYKKN